MSKLRRMIMSARFSRAGEKALLEMMAFSKGRAAAIVATVGGGTTGLIPLSAEYITVTSSAATKQISLPAGFNNQMLKIMGPTNGCELISTVAADKVNGVVVGATNEAALVAGTLYTLVYDAAGGNWIMTGLDENGAVETPVVPNAL